MYLSKMTAAILQDLDYTVDASAVSVEVVKAGGEALPSWRQIDFVICRSLLLS